MENEDSENENSIRIWPRYSHQVSAEIALDDDQVVKAYTVDLSEGGMKILAPLSLEEGQQIQINISFQGIKLRPLVKVRRSKKQKKLPGISLLALQFLHLSHDEKIQLHKLFYQFSLPKALNPSKEYTNRE